MSLADFVHLEGYKVSETYKHLDAGYVLIAVESAESEMVCKRCNTRLEDQHGKHRLMPSTCLSSLTMHLLSAGGGKVFAHRAKKLDPRRLAFCRKSRLILQRHTKLQSKS